MRNGVVIAALLVLAAGAWWMYSDREERLDPEGAKPSVEEPPPAKAEPQAPSLPLEGRDGPAVLKALPGDARDVLENADTFEILALHPDGGKADGKTGAEVFHDYLVLGRATIDDPKERRELIEAFYFSMNGNEGEVADCFLPRHGLHVVRGDRTIDVVFCFECLQALVHGAKAGEMTNAYLLEMSEPVFDDSLKNHGLEKHKRDTR